MEDPTEFPTTMKKILIALSVTLVLPACVTLYHIAGYDILLGIDFRPYAEKGFLFTPHEYNGDYTSIYMIDYIIMPTGIYKGVVLNEGKATQRTVDKWVFDEIDVKAAVDSIYHIAIEMGADAIAGFEIKPYETVYADIENPVIVQGIEISGVAIKRE